MNRYNSCAHVGVMSMGEASIFHTGFEFSLCWEFADALNEVLVAVRILRDDFSHGWDRGI